MLVTFPIRCADSIRAINVSDKLITQPQQLNITRLGNYDIVRKNLVEKYSTAMNTT